MTTVLVIRHGRTALNADGALRGRVDVPLDEVGLAEAARLGDLFEPVPLMVVVCSPLLRARQTAAPIANSTGAAVRIEEAFTDRDVGGWSGMPAAQVVERFGGLDHAPGVEPRADFDRRVLAGWASVAAELAAGRPWFWLPAQMTSGLSGAWSDVQPVSRARRRRRNGDLPPRGRSVTPVAGPGRWRGLGQAAAWRAGGRRSAEAVTDSTIQPAA